MTLRNEYLCRLRQFYYFSKNRDTLQYAFEFMFQKFLLVKYISIKGIYVCVKNAFSNRNA